MMLSMKPFDPVAIAAIVAVHALAIAWIRKEVQGYMLAKTATNQQQEHEEFHDTYVPCSRKKLDMCMGAWCFGM
jgi:hypothetical protein